MTDSGSALGTHVGAALGNELQIGVSIEGRLRRQLHRREPIHARIHLLVRDEQHKKGKGAEKSEKGPRGPLHRLSSSFCSTFPVHRRGRASARASAPAAPMTTAGVPAASALSASAAG